MNQILAFLAIALILQGAAKADINERSDAIAAKMQGEWKATYNHISKDKTQTLYTLYRVHRNGSWKSIMIKAATSQIIVTQEGNYTQLGPDYFSFFVRRNIDRDKPVNLETKATIKMSEFGRMEMRMGGRIDIYERVPTDKLPAELQKPVGDS